MWPVTTSYEGTLSSCLAIQIQTKNDTAQVDDQMDAENADQLSGSP